MELEYLDCLTFKGDLVNRSLRREAYFEFKKILESLSIINQQFLKAVFIEDNGIEYIDAYNFYLEQWNYVCDYIMKHEKPKYIHIDLLWFSKNYKPLENATAYTK
jgi:hypothetical protein